MSPFSPTRPFRSPTPALAVWLVAAALSLAAGRAGAQITPTACLNGAQRTGSGQYTACDNGNGLQGEALDHAERLAPFHLRSASVGTYRFGGDFSDHAEVNLAAGTIRQRMLFGNEPTPYEIDSDARLGDVLTFSGSGTAILKATLTGAFVGAPHRWYYDRYTFNLTAWRIAGDEFVGGDITGQLGFYHRDADALSVDTSGCGATWALGVVGCRIVRDDPLNVFAELWLELTGLEDGDQVYFLANGVAGVYASNDGGVDFGHTARLALATDPGLGWTSESGVFLTQASTVPEPASLALLATGVALLGAAAARRGGKRR